MTEDTLYDFNVLGLMCALQECDLLPGLADHGRAGLSLLRDSALTTATGDDFVAVYRSTALISRPRDLKALLEHSRTRNAQRNITGVMLHYDTTFLQVLEGDEQAVRALLARIDKDPRHTRMDVIFTRTGHRRVFRDWSMEMIDVSPEDFDSILCSLSGYGSTAGQVMSAMQMRR